MGRRKRKEETRSLHPVRAHLSRHEAGTNDFSEFLAEYEISQVTGEEFLALLCIDRGHNLVPIEAVLLL